MPINNPSQVKVVQRGRHKEYSWKRHRMQLDRRWLYLAVVLASFYMVGDTIRAILPFLREFSLVKVLVMLIPLSIPFVVLLGGLKCLKLFIQHNYEQTSLEIHEGEILITTWPFKRTQQLKTGDWTQLYVSPSEELRVINRQGEHQVLACGPIPDLQLVEAELEKRLKLVNVRVEGESWDLDSPAVPSQLHPMIKRQQTGDRLKLSWPERAMYGKSFYWLSSIWLLPHYLLIWYNKPFDPVSYLFGPMTMVTSWPGYAFLYYELSHYFNTTTLFVDPNTVRMTYGPIPTYDNQFSVPMAEVRRVNFVKDVQTRTQRGGGQNHTRTIIYYKLELCLNNDQVKQIAMTCGEPDLLNSAYKELNQFVQELKANAGQAEQPTS